MKIFFLSLVFSLVFYQIYAQESIYLKPFSDNSFNIAEATTEKISIEATFGKIDINSIKTLDNNFVSLQIGKAMNRGKIGSPALPQLCKIIRIPEKANMKVVIDEQQFAEITLSDYKITDLIFPEQRPQEKTSLERLPFDFDKTVYKTDSLFGSQLIECEIVGNMRNMRLATMKINPVKYNPVQKKIVICTKLRFTIYFNNADISQTERLDNIYGNSFFANSENMILNNTAFRSAKDQISQYPTKYIIVSDSMFRDELHDFITWKTKKGFLIDTIYVNNTFTADSIKKQLKSIYDNADENNPAPSFLLIVGDVEQVPTFAGANGSHFTDLYYAEYTGDFIPDVYYGRFSAKTLEQLQPQLAKTLEYEKYLFAEENWLDTIVLVAGKDDIWAPIHANGQINYLQDYYFNEDHGLHTISHFHPESSNQDLQIRTEIGKGVSFANYTAHGKVSGWLDPSFTVDNVAEMNNKGKYPFIIGNSCKTNSFASDECFGEALLRANEKGAIGYVGASNSTYWNEDYYWAIGVRNEFLEFPSFDPEHLGAYDRFFHENNNYFSDWYVSQAQIIMAGNLSVLESGSSKYGYYAEIYHLMGDPSLMPYIGIPENLIISHPTAIMFNQTKIDIYSEPYVYVGLTQNGIWHGAGLTDENGFLTLDIIPFDSDEEIDIVATKQFRKPYISTISSVNPLTAFVLYNGYSIDDSNKNNKSDFGETVKLNVNLKNFGILDADGVTATLTTLSEYINISDNTCSWGTILAKDSATVNAAFTLEVDSLIPDRHVAQFVLTIRDENNNVWISKFNMIFNAPIFTIGYLTIVDSLSTTANNRLDAGETTNINISVSNLGHSDIANVEADLSTENSFINVLSSHFSYDSLLVENPKNSTFRVKVNENIPFGEIVYFKLKLHSGPILEEKDFKVIVGRIGENWESNDFSQYLWINDNITPWTISDNAFEGEYCAKSGNIANSKSTSLSITANVIIDDSISFYKKTSCEKSVNGTFFDYMSFSIDGNVKKKFAGISDWSEVRFGIASGIHTFTWTYTKDVSDIEGEDAVYIDKIIFPPMQIINSITNFDNATNIMIYPNPAIDNVNVTFNHCGGEFTIQIFNCFGQCVSEHSLYSPAGQIVYPINISTLEKAYYLVKIINKEQSIARSFLKVTN